MNGDGDREGPPGPDEERTAFIPGGGEATRAPSDEPPASEHRDNEPTAPLCPGMDPAADGSEPTEIPVAPVNADPEPTEIPAAPLDSDTEPADRGDWGSRADGTRWAPLPEEYARSPAPPSPNYAPPSPAPYGLPPVDEAAVPRTPSRGIQVGDVLNHIFEVKRFIARGGMGEVFEGSNVNSEERVAIKVMLPGLAADPNVISMFRKEARTLTRLQHEALVQYRVLAQEPQLGVLYIVTEYIDGVSLSDVLSSISATPSELEALLRRLAGGLRAAHALGAIHRDMSPDNVLLEGGRLVAAKIIDFGIAKNLDPGSGTIVGDGFAGKLGYVAPEQLGDFGRDMGPWTDVYSLALVILAIARGRDVQMGGTLVDAVDKRRAGPDLSAAPDRLRPVLEKMLKPNPAERLRSMDEVLEALDRLGKGQPDVVVPRKPRAPLSWPPPRPYLLAGGAAAAGLVLLALIIWLFSGDTEPVPPVDPQAQVEPVSRPKTPDEARKAIQAILPSIDCSWLDVASLEGSDGRIGVKFTGVARSPAPAQAEISRALASAGFQGPDIDFGDVAQNEAMNCATLDALRRIRAFEGGRVSVPSRTFELEVQPNGEKLSKAVIELAIGDPNQDLAVAVLEPSGQFAPLILGRDQLNQFVIKSSEGQPIAALGDDRFRVLSVHDRTGWTGILLVTGRGPFDPAAIDPTSDPQRFLDTARRQGWHSEMVWFKTVDDRPD